MRRTSQFLAAFFVAFFLLAAGDYGLAQGPGTQSKIQDKIEEKDKQNEEAAKDVSSEITVGNVLLASIMHLQRTFLRLAMAMPEDKYDYAPSSGEFKGVRTFAQQVKHVAATNYIFASAIVGEKPPVDVGDDGEGPASMKSRAEILKYVTDSFYYVQKAVEKINAKNISTPIKSPFGDGQATRLSMATLIIGHCNDHYGQLVVYLRMNGIVPPASQR
jgi:uncharacterized damage-inducible protein DinB